MNWPCVPFALDQADGLAIQQIIEHTANAWNNHEGHGFADYYSQDADFVNIFGMSFAGKDEIEERHIKILETILKGTTFEITNVRLREVTPEYRDRACSMVGHWHSTAGSS